MVQLANYHVPGDVLERFDLCQARHISEAMKAWEQKVLGDLVT